MPISSEILYVQFKLVMALGIVEADTREARLIDKDFNRKGYIDQLWEVREEQD